MKSKPSNPPRRNYNFPALGLLLPALCLMGLAGLAYAQDEMQGLEVETGVVPPVVQTPPAGTPAQVPPAVQAPLTQSPVPEDAAVVPSATVPEATAPVSEPVSEPATTAAPAAQAEAAQSEPLPELPPEPKMTDLPVVRLRSLDKISARTGTFEAAVGSTVKFGSLYIKARACRKASPMEQPESAAFLQIWEAGAEGHEPVADKGESEWIFSGWMFASSPGLSAMDHPLYDVWVLDCLPKKGKQDSKEKQEQQERGEGEVSPDQAPSQPGVASASPSSSTDPASVESLDMGD